MRIYIIDGEETIMRKGVDSIHVRMGDEVKPVILEDYDGAVEVIQVENLRAIDISEEN